LLSRKGSEKRKKSLTKLSFSKKFFRVSKGFNTLVKKREKELYEQQLGAELKM
jgi:hypothetical protein